VSAVLFTPGLPQIAVQLGISEATAQLTITIFLIGYALGFLPYGPLADRFGRKPTACLGISVAILGCLLTLGGALLSHFALLMLGRLLMALGSSVGMKITFTMIADTYTQEKVTKKISYLMLSFSIAPAIAISIGGFLTEHFGWVSCFYFQTGYSLLLLLLACFLPETCKELDPHALKIKNIAHTYLQKLKNTKLVLGAMLMGCGSAVIYLFAAEAPFIGIDQLKLTANQYGLLNLIPPIGLIAGALLANKLASKKQPFSTMFLGIMIATACATAMAVLFALKIVTPWSLFLPMPLLYLGESLVYANASSIVLSTAKNKSYASAMIGSLNMLACLIVLLIFGWLPWRSAVLMPIMFTVTALAMIILRKNLLRSIYQKQ
jgi:MFS family permease